MRDDETQRQDRREGQDIPIPIPGAFTRAERLAIDTYEIDTKQVVACSVGLSAWQRKPLNEKLDIASSNTMVQRQDMAQTAHSTRAETQCSELNGLGDAQAAPQPPPPYP